MEIFNQTQQITIVSRVQIAKTFFQRFKGLMGKSSIDSDEGLLIYQCCSIHMFFMRFPIDVCFLDRQWKVVGMAHHIQPFCLSRIFWRAFYALETSSGLLKSKNVQIGDTLILRNK